MVEEAKAVARFVWDFLIPHFETEDVALNYVGDDFTVYRHEWSAYEIACCLKDVDPGETFDAIAEVESFTWMGIGIAYRIGNFRQWSMESIRG